MNETIQSILNRKSCRHYLKDPVPAEALDQLITCGMYAPTAIHKEPWYFVAVTDRDLMDEMSKANQEAMSHLDDPHYLALSKLKHYDNYLGAPAVIFVFGDDSHWAETDCANAVENMAIAATSLGLGSCFLASHRHLFRTAAGPEYLRKLHAPEGFFPYFALAVGYPAPGHTERAGRDLSKRTHIPAR